MSNALQVAELILLRHAESVANVAAAEADAAGRDRVDVGERDADVPLSETGVAQAKAVGAALGRTSPDLRPQAVWSSPYRRALETARYAVGELDLADRIVVDERLRDRDLGVWDTLTTHGVRKTLAEEAKRRDWIGKFYYRPFGGEAWTDVALRVRSLLRDLEERETGRRVLVVAHDAVILTFRYVCEALTEDQVVALAREEAVANAGLTSLRRDTAAPSGWVVQAYNDVAHLKDVVSPPDSRGDRPVSQQ